jgi:hypothetical protein
LISATLDSSVYVRALHFGGPAALLIAHARAGNIRIDSSEPILNETLGVLRDKFQWNGYMIQDARGADSEGWRSAFRTDVDHDSEVMPISVPN